MDSGWSLSIANRIFAMTESTKNLADYDHREYRALSVDELDLVTGGMTNAPNA